MLDSATNALDKGQAQYFTPHDLALDLSGPLPQFRPLLVDLSCGSGSLLHAAANGSTTHLLGADIHPYRNPNKINTPPADAVSRPISQTRGDVAAIESCLPLPLGEGLGVRGSDLTIHRITADLTLLYPLLAEVNWLADLFVLNPPWDLHWHRDRLTALAGSDCSAVRAAFPQIDPRVGREQIDSTVATMMIALDRMTYRVEAFLIANSSTAQRLLFDRNAPYHALAAHVWHRQLVNHKSSF